MKSLITAAIVALTATTAIADGLYQCINNDRGTNYTTCNGGYGNGSSWANCNTNNIQLGSNEARVKVSGNSAVIKTPKGTYRGSKRGGEYRGTSKNPLGGKITWSFDEDFGYLNVTSQLLILPVSISYSCRRIG